MSRFNETKEGAYRVDVTDDARTWATNALRFATAEDATAYAYDLSGRWFAVRAARVVVDASTPDGAPVDPTDTAIVVNYLS